MMWRFEFEVCHSESGVWISICEHCFGWCRFHCARGTYAGLRLFESMHELSFAGFQALDQCQILQLLVLWGRVLGSGCSSLITVEVYPMSRSNGTT
jgi:hypothetical protein